MQNKYCWRCATDVPMLDEREYAPIMKRFGECLQDAKALRRKTGKAVSDPAIQACLQPVTELYSKVTGLAGIDSQEVMRHRLMLLGPPCAQCGKPLRTKKARVCAACGARVTQRATTGRIDGNS
jgi:hypothetical protein